MLVSHVSFVKLKCEADLAYWRSNFLEYSIRYYWKENTYYNIYLENELVGICGLHQLNKDRHYLLRGAYILDSFRGKRLDLDNATIHQISINYRVNLATSLGAKSIWVRCNRNSIKNYQSKGFKRISSIERQYVPLCLHIDNS